MVLRSGAGGQAVDGMLRPLGAPSVGAATTAAAPAAGTTQRRQVGGDAGACKDAGGGKATSSSRRSSFSLNFNKPQPRTAPLIQVRRRAPVCWRLRHGRDHLTLTWLCNHVQEVPASAPAAAPGGVCEPSYQVVERAAVDLGAAWRDTGRNLQQPSTAPQVRPCVLCSAQSTSRRGAP
jgi:hypothetical protein